MKIGKSVFDDEGLVFLQTGKPFDGWGPVSVAGAVGALTRSCEVNCYLSDGGDCCATQYQCEECDCQPCVGSLCSPDTGCESMTRADFEALCEVNCTTNPDACLDWSEEKCPVGMVALKEQCPPDYHWACRYNDRTKKYGCRYFKKTIQNYINFCMPPFNQCWDTKEECQACSDCQCNYGKSSSSSSSGSSSSSSSSACDVYAATDDTMGVCYWGQGSGTGSEMYCAPMPKGSCAVQEGWGINPNVGIPANAIYLNEGKSAWSCDGSCPGSCESVPTCQPGETVKTVTKRSILGYYYQECVCDNAGKKCADSYCNSCEFCHEGSCIGCDDPRRFVDPFNRSSGNCPYPLGYDNNSCGCRSSGFGWGYQRGCDECEFCTDSPTAQGGVCFPCYKNPYFGNEYDNVQYPERLAQCKPECLNPPSSSSSVQKNCVWEFTAQYDAVSGNWYFPSQAYSSAECLSAPYGFPTDTWYPYDCTTKLYKKVTSGCVATSDCVEPSQSEYPVLPVGPSECPSSSSSSSSSSPVQKYNCNYDYNETNDTTTYSCDPSPSGSLTQAQCEEAMTAAMNGTSSIWACPRPRFDCTYTGTEFSCYEATGGKYASLNACQEAITNSGCGYRYNCNPAGTGCEPDLTGSFTGKDQCEDGVAKGNCGKYSCKSYLNFPGTFVECEKNPYGVFDSLTDCKQHCCGTTVDNGESGFPEALGSCEYYQADAFSPLTPDYKICEAGLTRAQCMAKPSLTLLSGTWGPSFTCGSDCFADQLACPDCPSGRYRVKRTYPTGEGVCTCLGGSTSSSTSGTASSSTSGGCTNCSADNQGCCLPGQSFNGTNLTVATCVTCNPGANGRPNRMVVSGSSCVCEACNCDLDASLLQQVCIDWCTANGTPPTTGGGDGGTGDGGTGDGGTGDGGTGDGGTGDGGTGDGGTGDGGTGDGGTGDGGTGDGGTGDGGTGAECTNCSADNQGCCAAGKIFNGAAVTANTCVTCNPGAGGTLNAFKMVGDNCTCIACDCDASAASLPQGCINWCTAQGTPPS